MLHWSLDKPLNMSNRAEGIDIKVARLLRGEAPRVLDLFAGCGGLSLGFKLAGFDITAAVEIDKKAVQTHAKNFHGDCSNELFEIHATPTNIIEVEPSELFGRFEINNPEDVIDFIIGGPPCQAFARVGRAKLREVAEDPQAFLSDPRSNLYLRYLEYVEACNPLGILMENVPDVLNFGGHNIAEEVCEVLEELGYDCQYTLLNSAYYGVPQMREWMFLVAFKKELKIKFTFPRPTHYIDLPVGYEGSRNVALKYIRNDIFNSTYRFVEPPDADRYKPAAVTTRDAISDLPKLTKHLAGKGKKGARRFDTLVPYPLDCNLSSYSKFMREFPGFENREKGIYDHVIRHLPRDYAIFASMREGDQYPEAHKVALKLYELEILDLERNGKQLTVSRKKEIFKSMVPPYDPTKFPNKWRKLEYDMPSRTLLAHLGKDSYSHIHPDSTQARTISVREAARLQSFPDGFKFSGAMNSAFKQIGNSVPPLMAFAIAEKMMMHLNTNQPNKKYEGQNCYQEADKV